MTKRVKPWHNRQTSWMALSASAMAFLAVELSPASDKVAANMVVMSEEMLVPRMLPWEEEVPVAPVKVVAVSEVLSSAIWATGGFFELPPSASHFLRVRQVSGVCVCHLMRSRWTGQSQK